MRRGSCMDERIILPALQKFFGIRQHLRFVLIIRRGKIDKRLTQHPAYDHYWSEQAVNKILAARPLTVPTLYVHSQWDQEDIYGAMAAFAATHSQSGPGRDNSYLVIGPWRHGGGNGDGSSLGAIKFDGDTGHWFRLHVLLPFFDAHLKDDAPKADIATVTAFETGANIWRRYDQWPQSCASGCPYKSAP